MIYSASISRFSGRVGLFDHASRTFGPRSGRPFGCLSSASANSEQSSSSFSQIPQKSDAFPDCLANLKGYSHPYDNVVPQFLGNLGTKLGFMKMRQNIFPSFSSSFRSLHSGNPKDFETGRNSRTSGNLNEFETRRNSKSMNFVRAILDENRNDIMSGSQFGRYGVEQNADIVHINMMRNNTFVTLTDSKGNTKLKASSGFEALKLKGGPKASRYVAEATAEHVGRLARSMGLKSVVVKVNGFTYFKKKKQAILSFREGYTHSRGDQNPIVYIEDTTRRPHNGCRLRKKRRV